MIIDPKTGEPMEDFPESGRRSFADMEELAESLQVNVQRPPVRWIQEERYPDTWTPIFEIPKLGQKMGAPRKEKELMKGEKKLMVFAFANECARWLFEEPMFLETTENGAFKFEPNLKFDS